MPETIAARLLLDADAIASLRGPAVSPQFAEQLERIEALLTSISQRAREPILVDQREAARLMGVCSKTLVNLGVPFVPAGTRRMYRVEAIRIWAAEHEQSGKPAGVES